MKLNDWKILTRTRDSALAGWRWVALGEAPPITHGRALWFDLKVVREAKQPGRNSYHLALSLSNRRLAHGSEWAALHEREPALAAALEADLPQLVALVAL